MDTPRPHQDLIDQNRRAWNEVAPRHAAQNFERTRDTLRTSPAYYIDPRFRSCLEDAGVQGKTVAQFNCNNGRELISAIQLGYRDGYGFDFSAEFIHQARDLASGLDVTAEFIETDIYAIPEKYRELADVLFLTCGALCWMPSLRDYFAAAYNVLRPGGSLIIYETHPFLEMFKPDRDLEGGDPLELAYPYFMEEPVAWGSGLDYYSGEKYGNEIVHWYHHTLSNIMQSVVDSGFGIKQFTEFEYDNAVGYDEIAKQAIRPPMRFILRSDRSLADGARRSCQLIAPAGSSA
jgi:SAM-dependent methyltransferase